MTSRGALRNVDVTVVYPLPASEEDLIAGAPLLGDTPVPELDERFPLGSEAARRASLRVVALRIDPCSGETVPAAATCRPSLRLVIQSLRREGGALLARDGAMHAFFQLSPAQFAAVVDELRSARAAHAGDPETRLDVHPLLRSQGLGGEHAQRLRALVQEHAVALVRVTHFRRLADLPLRWSFRIRDKAQDGVWRDSPIVTTGALEQQLATFSGGRWDADITPRPAHADDVTKMFKVSSREEMQAAFAAVVRALNPRVHSSESIDCASCHIAPDIAAFARVTQRILVSDDPARFTSSFSLDAATHDDATAIAFDDIHMLSYSGAALNVSPRVANETAAVLEQL
jgi:GNAT superfamily N-acetyltransferase